MTEKRDDQESRSTGQMIELGQLSYRQLIWRRFRKSKLGIVAGVILIIAYIISIGADFFAPYHYNAISLRLRHVPPQRLHFSFDKGLHVYGLKSVKNPETLELEHYLREGDWVQVMSGPFAGVKGRLREIRGQSRLVINIDGIYQSASFVIEQELVERIESVEEQGIG